MKEVNGNIIQMAIDGEFNVIIHGCNCQCKMGKGIALAIKKAFPEAYEADCQTEKGSRDKLGTYSSVQVKNNNKLIIVNAYTQFHWRGNGTLVDYNAIQSVMKRIKQDFSGSIIGYPLIGAGLAGGDWEIISKIINQELDDEDHTLVRLQT